MKYLKLLLLSLSVAFVSQSCQSEPGEFSSVKASKFNYAPYSAEEAWSQAYKVLKDKAEILDDDSATLSLTVKFFKTPVDIKFIPVTDRSSKYTVTARNSYFYPAEDSVNTVYNELLRQFTK